MSTTQTAPASSMRNDYLDQVVRQKAQLENDLRARRGAYSKSPAPMLANDPAVHPHSLSAHCSSAESV